MPKVEGEQFTPRLVVDRQLRGMTAFGFRAPAGWKDQSRVLWDLDNPNLPATAEVMAENPKSLEGFYIYRPAQLYAVRPDPGYARDGSVAYGLTKANPVPPPQALAMFIQSARQGAPKLRLIGMKDLPDLPKVLKLNYAKTQKGIGIKVSYELNGKPVEEEFYSVYYYQEIPYDGPQGRTWQINWGLIGTHSFRAEAGTLDARRPVFGAIMKSLKGNPEWTRRVVEVQKNISARIQQQQQQGWDSIAAAGARSREISRQNDAMLAAIDKQLAASRPAPSANGRSSTDHFDDYVRGVDTTDDPYWGTSQHSSSEQYHWTDGYGSYRNSNDATYDPGQHEAGSWVQVPTR
ncbi:MAG TPA: hypothetical protein VH083_27335 [Myxococcales bacterium]|nr:hypothetical protein [Myxococcales bacterium]